MSYFEFDKTDFKKIDGKFCYRIRATRDFKNPYRNVKAGELGGYVGSCEMIENSWVFGNAVVHDCYLHENSYIVGDHNYKFLWLVNGSIQGTGDYIVTWGRNRIWHIDVVGHNIIKGSRHNVIWGTRKKPNELVVIVGCQLITIPRWKKLYKGIADNEDYSSLINEYLGYLKQIEDSLKPSNEKVLEKISENVSKLKSQVTEELKSETISLVTSLNVPEKVLEKSGPKRCPKTGRWLKKNP